MYLLPFPGAPEALEIDLTIVTVSVVSPGHCFLLEMCTEILVSRPGVEVKVQAYAHISKTSSEPFGSKSNNPYAPVQVIQEDIPNTTVCLLKLSDTKEESEYSVPLVQVCSQYTHLV